MKINSTVKKEIVAALSEKLAMFYVFPEIAEELCDQIAIIQKGTVIAQGTMEELQRQADTVDKRLEYLFLKLTGEDDIAETISALQKI